MRLLILGGYGVFGGRLARLLADLPGVEILIAGRDAARADRFCARYRGEAVVRPIQLDRRALDSQMGVLRPDLVVDASGPFQAYGVDPYQVIKTCIRHRVSYLDFADGADFVSGVAALDHAARQAGVFVLSGASSFPVLTAAVLREMAKSMQITSVTGGVAPSPHAGIGLNVMRAVLGYAGAPVKVTRGGRQTTAIGLAESLRYTVAVPGQLPLRNLRFSLVDVPDLQVLPPEHPGLQDIWMGAGPVPEVLHRALNILAKARAHLHLPSLAPLAPLFYRVLNLMKFGEHRGGMFVHAKGLRNGKPVEQSWHLLAEGDDGPFIPSMAIEAIIRKLLAGQPPETGARPATNALSLADYDTLFAKRQIHTGFRDGDRPDLPIYRQVLGDAFDRLPPQIRALHDDTRSRQWQGRAQVRRGTGLIASALARVFGFPHGTADIPVTVRFDTDKGRETWRRQFGEARFSSVQKPGQGRHHRLMMERFGPITVALALVVKDDRLFLVPRSWSCLGLPLPGFLRPKGNSFEAEVDGKFRFDVEIAAPLIGLIVAYQGELTPCP
jgi:hypothetical protein